MGTSSVDDPKVIEVFADIWCPFAHVGLHRLLDRRSQMGTHFSLLVRAWPLELVNDAPLDPMATAQNVAVLRAQVAPDLFARFDPERFPETTLPALAIAAAAYDKGPAAGERASMLIRDALFEHGLDISRPRVRNALSAMVGIARSATVIEHVLDDWNDGRRRGVIGSPHFFVDGQGFFCPSLHIAPPDGTLNVQRDSKAFEAFVRRCAAE